MSDPARPDTVWATEINRIVHEPACLLILSQLYVVETADFLYIRRQTGLTQGNLSSHLSKLEAAMFVEIQKEFVHKRPRTLLRLTMEGRTALEEYVATMRSLFSTV